MLIFHNCYKYNPPEHDVVSMARKLEDVFKTKMARMPKDNPPKASKDPGAEPSPAAGLAPQKSSGPSAAALSRLQEADNEESEDNSSDWNKRLLQVGPGCSCKQNTGREQKVEERDMYKGEDCHDKLRLREGARGEGKVGRVHCNKARLT